MTQITSLSKSQLQRHPNNREIVTTGEDWEQFRESIRQHGILTPLLVRTIAADQYQIIAGERRWRAAQANNLESIPCVIRDLSDSEALVLMMVENLQREDIDPIEEARGVLLLIEQAGLTREEISDRLNESAEWVDLRQGLLELPEDARELVKEKRVALGVMQMILHLPSDRRDEGLQMVLHPAFQDEPLNPRQAEQILEEEIIAPARARREWEERKGELQTYWTIELRKTAASSFDPFILQIADFDERALGQHAEDTIYRVDLTSDDHEGATWLHLAQRHGVPVRIHPAKVNHDQPQLENSVAMVDHHLVLTAEKALEEHQPGAAWLREAQKAKPTPESQKIDPDAREDQAELDAEDERNAPKTKTGGSLTGWVDLGKIKTVSRIFLAKLEPDCDGSYPDWLPRNWEDWEPESLRAGLEILEWVQNMNASNGGDQA
jgi:ParB family chromosome partitioning protein